ncbi:MAG: NDP-sugar synthase [Dehalococcoidia bacterium]
MLAVILAGGAGTRLRPLTYARRKELVPVLNRPLLEHRLRNLRDHGITDVVIACAADARDIEAHFAGGSALGVRLRYAYEERPLGSGRAVKEAARSVGAQDQTIVVCNGDIITDLDITAMVARHRETGATLSMSLASVDDPWLYGVAEVDDALAITSFVEKPPPGSEPSNLINAGTWIFDPEVLRRVPDDGSAVRDGFAERVLFPGLIADGLRVQGFREDLWMDLGSPERYLLGTRLLLERETARIGAEVIGREGGRIAEGAVLEGMVCLGDAVAVCAGARITGPTVLGARVRVDAGATVEASVIWEDARIGAGASVTRSIVGGGVRIGERASLVDAVIADGAAIAPGVKLEPGARIMPGDQVRA